MKKIFCFGIGYTALAALRLLQKRQWEVSGTVRTPEKLASLSTSGIECGIFQDQDWVSEKLTKSSYILCSIPPAENSDPTLHLYRDIILKNTPKWIGYLSSTVVYGNHNGAWVSENTVCSPPGRRGKARLQTEKEWQNLTNENKNISVDIFRLAGIYGPYRNALSSLKKQTARKIVKKGQVFGRIHRDDIVNILIEAMNRRLSLIYNCNDDYPSPPWQVIEYAEKLLKQPPLPKKNIDQANLSPMAMSFYQDNKRVNNQRIKELLDITLLYPTYREGLQSLYDNQEY